MTISSTTVRNSYSGDGSTTTFSYTFKIFQDSDIQVIIRSANGTETTKTITTHYTVTGAGVSAGGTVIFTSGNIPTSTQTVVLRRNIPQTQSIDYIANDPFPAESHEEGLDRATMAIQQLQEEVTRSLKLSKTNTMTSTEFTVGASDRANKILAFDTNGELAVTQELGTNRGNWATATTFNARDIVKDSSNNNIYIANTTHTSVGTTPISSNADVAKWDLIVDAQAATNAANNASNHASNSSNFANNSSNSANASANHASNSSNFANNASSSASNAAASEASVSANANASANSAANASNFANNSSNSANSASNHSANSSNFANNSSNHASNSSNFANNSSNSANASSNHASNSSNHAANSSNFANASSNHASNSSNFANNSSNHASNSSNHSANSSNFANNSSNHASNSSNFANNSSNFANTASNSANAANSARDAALAAADNFDDVYLGSKATDPALDNDGDALTAGDLYYNSTAGNLKYYTGSAWIAVTSGGITDLVQDTSPQLGGALDVNTFSITSTSNGNITLQPNGTGDVVLSADTVKIGDSNTDAVLTTDGTGDITISTNSGSNSGTVKIFDGVNGNIEITPNGSGVVKLDGLSYPTADGTANQVLKTDGSGNLSFTTLTSDGTVDWDTTVKTSAFTATANKGYFCNTTSAAFTVTLPSSPSAGDEIVIVDYSGTFATNNLTISATPKINGSNNDVSLTTNREATRLVYIDSTQGYIAYSGVNEGTAPSLTDVPATYSVDFLVIAGGGGGGAPYGGGGGGAGGYRTSTQTVTPGTVITVTVGGGGAGGGDGTVPSVQGTTGTNSSISGTGLTTITSAGGGGGGGYAQAALNGGSGGGVGSQTSPNTGGSGNTPSTSPSQGNNGGTGGSDQYYGGGGGGGAGAVGGNSDGSTTTSNAGGNGTASSITGSSVTRAGGGGGANGNRLSASTTRSPGGTGGGGEGGTGTSGSVNGTAGSTNTGGGGGGGGSTAAPQTFGTGASGGSGVVILSMPDASYSGTTTGSPTVATGVSGKTVLTFNGSGSYTT
jgi:hypothetical protein